MATIIPSRALGRNGRNGFLYGRGVGTPRAVGNRLLEPLASVRSTDEPIQCRERLGVMLNYYYREAA